MGSVLANYGTHPITHKQILNGDYVPNILSSMVMSGVYDNSAAGFMKREYLLKAVSAVVLLPLYREK